MDPFNLKQFELPEYMVRAFERNTAQLNVDCISHYDRCFDKYFKLKKEGCKDKQRILIAKNNGLADFRSKVDQVALGLKSNSEFVKMVKDSMDLKERNQSYAVIRRFEDIIDQNANELKKNPEDVFSWWPSKTQLIILIALPAGLGAFTYFCYAAGAVATVAGIGVAVGTAIILGLGFTVYKFIDKKKLIEKIGEKLRQLPTPPQSHNPNVNGVSSELQNYLNKAPSDE